MTTVKLCSGYHCKTKNDYLVEKIEQEKAKDPALFENVTVERCGCQGNCKKGPTIVVEQDEKEEILPFAHEGKVVKALKKSKGKR